MELEEGKVYTVGDKKYTVTNGVLEEVFPKIEVIVRKMTAAKASLLPDIIGKYVAAPVDRLDIGTSDPIGIEGCGWLDDDAEIYVIEGLE